MLYKDKKNNIQTTFYHKSTDQQAFLHAKLKQQRSLKSSNLYGQAFKLKKKFFYNYRIWWELCYHQTEVSRLTI